MTIGCVELVGQSTTFKYQGSLTDSRSPGNGSFQMQFRLCNNAPCSATSGQTIVIPAVQVTNGIFSVDLDFAGAGVVWENERFLEVSVRKTDQDPYTLLLPRQPVRSSPFSIKAKSADTAASATNATTAGNASNLGGLPPNRYVQSDANGNVAIGTSPNGSKLIVAGVIESTTGGIKFPDGTTQTIRGLSTVNTVSPLTGNGTAASPLGIQSTILIRDADNPARQPVFLSASSLPADVYTVPAGKRFVVEYVSGFLTTPTTSTLPYLYMTESGSGNRHFMAPETWRDSGGIREWIFSTSIRMYFSPGQQVNVSYGSNPTSFNIKISGYLVDLP